MKYIEIIGGKKLTGEIKISGAKNSAVALVPASILADGIITIDNIPNISDIIALEEILSSLNVKVVKENDKLIIDTTKIKNKKISEQLAKKLRASYYFMGAMLGRFGKCEMYFPGGCSIGARPINLHLKAFKALGAKIKEDNNKFLITAKKLKGGNIYFDFPSVGATINAMFAASLAEGKTVIENAAKEPEIVNVATFLNQMGAKIKGAGTSTINIIGVSKLNSCYIENIPDRIEAGTYLIAGALMGNKLTLTNIIPEHIESLISKLEEMGVKLELGSDYIKVSKANKLNAVNIKTMGYPGFPTDLQQPMTVLLTQCHGKSILEEGIYENRFQNVPYLNEMGAKITIDGRKISVTGPTKLKGCITKATDLRAGACLVLAALLSKEKTTILDAEHVLRGYENICDKLSKVGLDIKIIEK